MTTLIQKSLLRAGLGLLLFGMAYAILNQHLLTQSILYRAAAYDYDTAISSLFSFGIQGLLLLVAVVILPRFWFIGTLILIAISSAVNITYGQLLNDTIDLQKVAWVLTEARQAGNAASEFAIPTMIAIGKLLLAILLLWSARRAMRQPVMDLIQARLPRKTVSPVPVILIALLPSLVWPATGFGPEAAERNVYGYLARLVTAEPAPERRSVAVTAQNGIGTDKILWIVDESVSQEIFSKIIKPDIPETTVVDYGRVASMGNCSTPANVALRSGVNVRNVDEKTDLRTTPSIWGYARKAGYETILIDGQVSGPPQNLLLAPERKLLDNYRAMKGGLRTDFKIAQHLNGLLKSDGRKFVLVLLRGVHFQYRDHFPREDLVAGSSIMTQYKQAVSYSKKGFFDELLKGTDRSKMAVFYTSDHGQNISPGVLPHCSTQPVEAEFSVPLLAFLPPGKIADYAPLTPAKHSASQIFPTTLQLMGYPDTYAQKEYDNDLKSPTAQYVWFGRGVFPVSNGSSIDINKPDDFPGR